VKKALYYEVWPRTVDTLTTWNSVKLDIHSRKRRVLNQSFSAEALKSAEPFVLSNTNRWCELLARETDNGQEGWSKLLNMADWVNYLVFDILGDLCFGKSFDMKEPESDLRFVPHLMTEFLVFMHPIAYSPFAGLWAWLKPRGLDSLLAIAAPPALQNWESFVEKCLADRTQVESEITKSGNPGAGRKDFFHYLFHAVDPETGKRGFPLQELYGEAESLIIAGSDTTAIIMSAMFFYLAHNPAIQAKLASEILGIFSSTEDIGTGPKLGSCRYLRAVIQEALRMTPPVSAEPSRQVMQGGTIADEHFFPEGVHVSVGLYCLSYSKDIFSDPFRFKPERWIVGEGGSTERSVELAESGFCAFSHGTRGCPGRQLAWMEMSVVMASVIFSFEIKADLTRNLGGGTADGKIGRRMVDQYQTYDAFVSMRDGPLVQFKKRVHSGVLYTEIV
jgi:cytochrome P450